MGWEYSTQGAMRNAYKILVGKPEGKGPFGALRRRMEDNIRTDLREIVWEIVEWLNLDRDRERWRALVDKVMNLGFP